MVRYSREGKRTMRKPRPQAPQELIAAIDAQAVKVYKLRDERDSLQSETRRLELAVDQARAEADLAADPGMRMILYDKAEELTRQAEWTRSELGRVQKCLPEQEVILADLHARARESLREGPG